MNNIQIILSVLSCALTTGIEIHDLNKGLSSFASEFYQECATDASDKNIIISPLSISTALALLSQGAHKNTFEQIINGLHLENDKNAIAVNFAEHHEKLIERAGNVTLTIINQLYVEQGFQIKEEFHDIAVNQFKSGIESLNFTDASAAANAINTFVQNKTNNKIKDLVQSDAFDADTRLVVINAIHFNGSWDKPFEPYLTTEDTFFTNEENSILIDFMRNEEYYRFAQLNDLNATALELKYYESNISFLVILPNTRTGLPALEQALRNYSLIEITNQLEEKYVEVIFPKFKIEYDIEMSDMLSELGMNEMFDDLADFSGLLETPEHLKVSQAIHKAFIEVDENGTEAAAASGFIIDVRISNDQTIEKTFRADHPFLFFIMDIDENTIIFSGRYKSAPSIVADTKDRN